MSLTAFESYLPYASLACFLAEAAARVGARGGRTAIAGRLRQLDAAPDERPPAAAVNGGNVRYHGGSAGSVPVEPGSDEAGWPDVAPPPPLPACWLTSVRADRDADLQTAVKAAHTR